MKASRPKGKSLMSRSWAELGTMLRQAILSGNEMLAVRIKQAIDTKKHISKCKRSGLDPMA